MSDDADWSWAVITSRHWSDGHDDVVFDDGR